MGQEMPEKGRISGTSQVYLLWREKETREFSSHDKLFNGK